MSQENVESARAGYAALNEEDMQRWVAMLDENVELHELAGLPDGAVYRGHSGVLAWYEAGREVIEDFGFEIEEIRDLGDTVLARVRAHGVGRGGGVPFEQRLYHVLEFRNGIAWRIRGFLSETEALEAAGLKD
jgi:ketosteroid isomerase-like protein